MNVQVNLLAVLLAAISSMVIGTVWYGKGAFGVEWQKLVKLDDKKMRAKAAQAISIAFVTSLLMAYVLAHVAFLSNYFFRDSFMQDAIMTSLWLWLGFQGPRVIMHDAFEQRRRKLTLINIGNDLLTIVVMGMIIGWLKPF